jgi:hypothetical protein
MLNDGEDDTNEPSEIDYIKVQQEQQKINMKEKELKDKKEATTEKLAIDRKKATTKSKG